MATKKQSVSKKKTTNQQATLAAVEDVLISELLTKESNSVLRIAVIVSVVFHLMLLSIKFGGAQALENLFKTKPLEVVLINAQTDEAPSNPQVVSNVDVAGGGESDNERDYASSPDTYAAIFEPGDSFEDIVSKTRAEENKNLQILQTLKDTYNSFKPIDPSWGEDDPRRIAEEDRRRQLADRIAVLDQQVKEVNARPRRLVIAPSAKRDEQALYFDAIRSKIEQKGNDTFPRIGNTPIFGILQIELIVNPQGEFLFAKILESSGNPVLDNQALAIARESAPFKAAPPELLQVEKNLEIAFHMRFNFHKAGEITVELLDRR